MRRLLDLFLLNDGRKVGFGLWVFVSSVGFLIFDKITSGDWLTCIFISTALIGGGTVADKFIGMRNGNPSSNPK